MRRINYIFGVLLVLATSAVLAQDKNPDSDYRLGSDSMPQENVPQGIVKSYEWLSSNVYPGTKRRFYTYVPAQYDPNKPAALMVFLDGHAYVSKTGSFRVPIVFDNLIHQKQMPVTIGVFVDPGHKKDKLPDKPGWQPYPENRAIEYDTPDGTFSKFLIDEILAEVKKQYNISDDPQARAICGSSSGGICAFTVAWERPDHFRKVISHIGSFVNIRGGDTYPGRIRQEKKRPMRILLQDGSGDLDNKFRNWPLANQQMYAALKYREYDVKFVYGKGAHNGKHGGAILPNSLRWLWRGFENVETNLAVVPEVQNAPWAQSWWMKRHEEKLLERKKLDNDIDLLMVGDSITHSWENGGKQVWNKYYAHRKPLNIGFSGDRTENVLWRSLKGMGSGPMPVASSGPSGMTNAKSPGRVSVTVNPIVPPVAPHRGM